MRPIPPNNKIPRFSEPTQHTTDKLEAKTEQPSNKDTTRVQRIIKDMDIARVQRIIKDFEL